MHFEGLRLGEALAAAVATKPALGLVDEYVPFHVGLKGEGTATNGAREGLDGAMRDQVVAEVVLLHEAHATLLAREAAHLRVNQHVVAQLARVLEQPFAHLALELVGGVGGATGLAPATHWRRVMFGHMRGQVAWEREAAAAECAGKAAAAMSDHVPLEVRHLQEAMLAVGTAVRPPALVDEEVRVKVGLLLEGLVAHLALEPLQTRVTKQMSLQVMLLRELFAAYVALPGLALDQDDGRRRCQHSGRSVSLQLAVWIVAVTGHRTAGVSTRVRIARQFGAARRRHQNLQFGVSVCDLSSSTSTILPLDTLTVVLSVCNGTAAGPGADRDAVLHCRFRRAKHVLFT